MEAARQGMQSDQAEPGKDQRLADLGHAALSSGDYGLAEAYLDAALAINPDNAYALHNLGVVYYNTNRTEEARELYAKLVTFDPSDRAAVPSEDEPAGAPAIPDGRHTEVGLDSAPMATVAVAPAPDPRPRAVDRAVLDRFATLARLREAGLISAAEYAQRRGANLGALAPLTGPPPSPALARAAPPAKDVIDRLRTIAAFRAAGALTAAEFAAERTAILDGLMPATGGEAKIAAAPRPPAEQPTPGTEPLGGARAVDRAPADPDKIERETLMALPGPASPATAPIEAEPLAASYGNEPKAAAVAPAGRTGPAFGVHVASYRTRARAMRGWDILRSAHGDVLEDLEPHVARVDLGPDTGVFFRLRAGPLADEPAARTLCRELKRRQVYCVPSIF